jgi:hypothetical protein
MYEFFEQEYKLLNKRVDLEERIKQANLEQLKDNNYLKKLSISMQDNEKLIDQMTNDSNKYYATCLENSHIYNHNKFKTINPVIKNFIEISYEYFDKLKNFFQKAYLNKDKLNIIERPVNARVNEKVEYNMVYKKANDEANINFSSKINLETSKKIDSLKNSEKTEKNEYGIINKKQNEDSGFNQKNSSNFRFSEKMNDYDSIKKSSRFPGVPEYEDNYRITNNDHYDSNSRKTPYFDSGRISIQENNKAQSFYENNRDSEYGNKNKYLSEIGFIGRTSERDKIGNQRNKNNIYEEIYESNFIENRNHPKINDFLTARFEKDPNQIFSELFDDKKHNQITFRNENQNPPVHHFSRENVIISANNFFD